MATRRDQDLPSHPSTSPGGRPRIPEREITTTDVTQHASEILTDQDFLITTPSEGDFFRHDGSDWVNVSGVPAADITSGTFGSGDYTFPLGLVTVESTNGDMFRLKHDSPTGSPFMAFYQDTVRGGYIMYEDGNDLMRFAVENNVSATFEWYADGDQVMFLHSTIGLQVRAGDVIAEEGILIAKDPSGGALAKLHDTGGAGSSAVAYLGFYDSAGNRGGFVGLGSGLDADTWLFSDTGNIRVQASGGANVKFQTDGNMVNYGGDIVATV